MVHIFRRASAARSSCPESPARLLRRPFAHIATACAVVLVVTVLVVPAFAQKGVSISFLPDPTASLRVEEAASPAKIREYNVYVPSFMAFSRLPGGFNGAIWLRFAVGPAFEKPTGPLRVNLGTSLPGVTRLFIPHQNGTMKTFDAVPPSGIFTLSDDAPLPDIFYARLDGMPSLWFRPAIEAATASTNLPPLHLILAGLFGLTLAIMLVQYVRKGEQWRLWGAITAGCGIAAALIPPLPAAGMAFDPLTTVGLVMPGVIILFFAHTARHIFATPKTLPGYDKLLLFYYLAGAFLALIPLVPGFLWTARYLPLLPLLLVPLLPLGMATLGRSLKGGMLFFTTCLLAVAGVAASAWELTSTTPAYVGGSASLWGFALGMALLSLAGNLGQHHDEPLTDEDVFDSLDRAPVTSSAVPMEDSIESVTVHPASPMRESSDEPHAPPAALKLPDLASPSADKDDDFPALSLFADPDTPPLSAPDQPLDETAPAAISQTMPALSAPSAPAAKPAEQARTMTLADPAPMRLAYDAMPEKPAQLIASAPPVAADKATVPATAPMPILADEPEDEPAPAPAFEEVGHPMPASPLGHGRKRLFDLPLLAKGAYDSLAPFAEQKNVAMSWFIAPQTGRLFEGEADLLESALRLLLRDMVEGAERGSVRLNIRRLPDSGDAGHIAFTLVRADAHQTTHARNMAGLAEAWSLAEKTGGIFSVEHSPGGTTVIFSAMLTAVDTPAAATTPPPAAQAAAPGHSDVPVFADYPDIVMPESGEQTASASPVPTVTFTSGAANTDLPESGEGVRDPARVMVIDVTASGRARIAAALAHSPYALLQCATTTAVPALYARHPAALLIMSGALPERDITETLQTVHTDDAAKGRSRSLSLILVEDSQQADRMLNAGVTRTMTKPVMPEALLEIVRELLPLPTAGQNTAPLASDLRAPTVSAPAAAPKAAAVTVSVAPGTPAAPAPTPSPAPAPTQAPALSSAPTPTYVTTKTFASPPPKPSRPSPAMIKAEAFVPAQAPALALAKAQAFTPAQTTAQPAPSAKAQAKTPAPAPAQDKAAPAQAKAPASKPAAPEARLGTALANPPSIEPGQNAAGSAPGPEVAQSAIFSTALPAQPEAPKPVAPAAKNAGPSLGLLDMIIADDGVPTNDDAETGKAAAAQPAIQSAIQSVGQSAGQSATQSAGQAAPTRRVTPIRQAPPAQKEPETDDFFGNESPAADVPPPGAQSSIPLPDEDDGIYTDMAPLIPGLIHDMNDALVDILRGREEKDMVLMLHAAERVAGKSAAFGMSKLERMARCVERAIAANDTESTECIIADLEELTSRYKAALVKLHRSMPW